MSKKSKKADVWMPLYVGDYLKDTTRLTTLQHGAYMLLIMDYWSNGPIPDDDENLAQITRMQLKDWKKIRPIIEKLFKQRNGFWYHKRIDEEIQEAKERTENASQKAKKAAEARWGNDASRNTTSDAPSIPTSTNQALHDECQSQSHPQSQSPVPNTFTTDLDLSLRSGGDGERCTAVDLSIEFRKNGISTQPADPRLIALASQGVSIDTVKSACEHAKTAKPNERIPVGYVIKILEGWTRESHWINAVGARPTKGVLLHEKRSQTLAGLTGENSGGDDSRTIDGEARVVG